jgi:hypothetical protein
MTIVEKINALEDKDIMMVYSGKPGCACGCRGSYRVHPLHLAVADKDSGYAHDASDVNLTQVKKVLRILKTHVTDVQDFGTGYSVELDGRCYAAYTLPVKK